jgi:aspartyl-tRNA(Asn)/glutamyl-tRNA(Gln) amidotransferase subunit A
MSKKSRSSAGQTGRQALATDPADFSAIELLCAYRQRSLSPVEAVRAVLRRIAAWEPELGAVYAVHADAALEQAAAAERRWLRGAPEGALDGVPITIKDLIATKGEPVPLGTAASILTPAAEDSPPVARVRDAGAIMVGRTTMPDFGMLSSGLSSYHPLGRNPWDLSRNPGGSSGGAAAAAAAGMGPLHLGTDIGGSVRLPAGWCGIFALKPSFGRVPIDPPYIGRVAGPMTRTVGDAALLMSVLAQPDWRDHMALPPEQLNWSDLRLDLRGKRFGLMLRAGCGLPVEPQTEAAVRRAASLFEAEGGIIAPVEPFLTQDLLDGLDLFWRTRFWSDISTYPQARRDKMLPFILAWAQGAEGATGQQVYAGFDAIMQLRRLGNETMRPFDYIVSPTAPIAAFDARLPCPTDDAGRPFEHITFTVPFNMTDQPAASVNAGFTADGLPIGLQIVGRRFDDLGVLGVAAAFEKLRGPQPPWPLPGGRQS